MNKRKRKQQTKLSTPLIGLILGGILLVIGAVFFTFAGGDGGGMPKLVVSREKIDYGNVRFGNSKSFAFKVTNTGNGLLRFKEKPYIEVLEGC